jgi:cytochrome c biogenesis protein
MEEAETMPRAKNIDLADLLAQRGYQVFMKGKKLYAFKGLIGRLAPIGVHAGLLLTLGGSAYSALGGLGGSVMAPEGTSFEIGAGLRRGQPFAPIPSVSKDQVMVNGFNIEYLANGQVSQFFSDLSVLDGKTGLEKQRKTISVNVPLRQGGVTMYQTDWAIASMQVKVEAAAAAGAGAGAEATPLAAAVGSDVDGGEANGFGASMPAGGVVRSGSGGDSGPAPERLDENFAAGTGEQLMLPMANLEGQGNFQGRIWGTFLPLNPGATDPVAARVGISLLARDFQSVAIYGGATPV